MGLCCLDNELHHNERTDCDNEVVVFTVVNELFKRSGYNALFALGAVVGHKNKLVGASLEFVLENNEVLVSEADN